MIIDAVKRELLAGRDLTRASEISAGRGWSLPVSIIALRRRGWPIVTTRSAGRIAHYALGPLTDEQRAKLRGEP